jgi:hypothetical protein
VFTRNPWLTSAVLIFAVAVICGLMGGILVALDYARKGRKARSGALYGSGIGASIGFMLIGALFIASGNAKQDTSYILLGLGAAGGGLLLLLIHRMFQSEAPPEARISHKKRVRAKNIFISYRRDDSPDVTGRIYDHLVEQYGKAAIFKDVDSIPFGVDFRVHLKAIVEKCDVVLAVVGDSWLTITNSAGQRRLDDERDFVRIEIESALQRDIPVVPILVQGALMPHEADLPPALKEFAYRNATTVRHDPDFHVDMERLINSLDQP